jgi:antirestriction protein ArdC
MSQTPSQTPEQQPEEQATEQKEKKNRFSISREEHEKYVTDVSQTINTIVDKVRVGDRPFPVSPPFCPATGFAYGGSSMTRLMLESIDKGYSDDRWMTFNQLQNHKVETRNFHMKIRKGEHGVRLLRTEEVSFVVDKEGKWEFLSDEKAKYLRTQGNEVQRKTLFYPYTVFNASQIEGFPPKEQFTPAPNDEERNAAIDKFVACLGVKLEHGHEKASYDGPSDTIRLPDPQQFTCLDDYYSMKLRLAFHATSHNDRERREPDNFEVMRGEAFSLLAGARFGLPMPVDGGAWPNEFKGAEKWKAMEASADASKMLSVLDQFSRGEEPKAQWFPKKEEWPAMVAAQEMPPPAPVSAPASSMRMR